MSIIKVENLHTQYNDVIIHDGISFDVKKGEIFGILGGSGSGKSTLLKNMLFLEKPTAGTITFFGENIWSLAEDKRGRILDRCGVMFQFGALFSSMNVLDNVGFLLTQKSKYDEATIRRISKMWLEMVGLSADVGSKYPYELSGGMKKRVALARALALNPDILFLDEPTSGLDLQSSERFDSLILRLKEVLEITIVMVTHDLDSIKDSVDRLILLEDKKIVFQGSLNELYTKVYQGHAQAKIFSGRRGERFWESFKNTH
ncbi:MAG: ATP-binding cassette domain-containing protein [Helicobacter sp.]|uniref:ABC transporter ATP-binding protein n=1 Tax=Helicobacter sp. TaxID=218 RepID=UPI0025BA3E47|nr:ATP-binding cassette domain-containing protein [Helicobacter sp.]MCH5313568.1 ATP-binding cassette domain-containing protein [Helicobacter sp.]